ncbi:MAG TPA: DNA gyrase subunit A, partial [Dehalococcoidia bacterium]|nr:DNA gyrase subunit A [Dehalococcoidia bacterium]
MTTLPPLNIRPIRIEEEMRASYVDYAMSVNVSRAIPDVRDGLKPVQRRILFAMEDIGLAPGNNYQKCAGIVGEVIKKYHPHGDTPIYDALVRLAQDFSMRYPLVDGQGNFGSVDGDPPAAYRYTEARLTAIAAELLADIDKNTVDFQPNFDDRYNEPMVLPTKVPNLLVNGASGIGVSLATNIPPHNLGEVCDAVALLLERPDASSEELTEIIKGPDFPTGGIIFGRHGIRQAYSEGRGRIVVRARAHVEESRTGRAQIIVTELPYQVNKAALVGRIAELVKARKIDGISDLRDESDRHGMRILIELGRGGQPRVVLNALYKHTSMQTAFAVNMLALVDREPRTIRLKSALEHYLEFRREVIRRRTEFELEKAKDRAHVLEGLLKAIDNLDAVIAAIRASDSAEDARVRLQAAPFDLTERQAQAVLDMQLRRLAALERQKIEEEYNELIQQINYLEDLLANPRKIDFLIKEEAAEMKTKYGNERRTQIVEQEIEDFSEEDLIPHQEVLVTLTNRGYIKRVPLETYRPQRRGGRGVTGMNVREEDAIRRLLVADTHDNILFFTDRGRVFQLKAHDIADSSRTARGTPLVNLIEIDTGELVTAVVSTASFDTDFMLLATKKGEIKKTSLKEFASVRRAGLIAMNLEADDELVFARLSKGDDDVVLVSRNGKAIRFTVTDLRSASRASGGVRGMKLAAAGDEVVAMEVVEPGAMLLTLSETGLGKRTPFDDYPKHSRGGQGVLTHSVTDRTGLVAVARAVLPTHELIVVSESGIVMRTTVDSISVIGRSTQGVHVMNVGAGDRVASIAVIDLSKVPEEPLGALGDEGDGAAENGNGDAAPKRTRRAPAATTSTTEAPPAPPAAAPKRAAKVDAPPTKPAAKAPPKQDAPAAKA